MKIQINLTKESIENAIKAVNDYNKKLYKIKADIAEELAHLGANVVEENYMYADEDKPVIVDVMKTSQGYVIIAKGENVMFLEFGTGLPPYIEDYEHEPIDVEIRSGAWSETEGTGTFARHGHWHYRGVDYEGTQATLGFYFARKEIIESAPRIVKEVIKRYD